ncbi:amino acid ABC transporter [Pokkaliibacter plantistimulans]|uniref:Amino acid ABC transporter n=1 Tax=Pokkaliibacter plantistimulans TaxID=1635171 RepID=A0ABX5LT74_9GAMM|nr:ABC transporter substrate-binding protein [Pokkaliibacter plantistimulans]PXF29402.1 amino acid ABC transporter [Pokkaliibacter plantistimulans]
MMSYPAFKQLLLTSALTIGALTSLDAAATTLRIGTEGAYPPFNYVTPDGQLAGFDVEIGKALCQQMQADCSFVAQDWDGIIPALQAGKYDVILASMFITEQRKQQVSFTEPYYKAAMTFVTHKEDAISDFSPSALAGKVIGAQSSTTQADYIAKVYPDAELRLYPTQDEANLDMVNGRLDLMVGDLLPMMEWTTKTKDGDCCTLAGQLITDPTYVGEGVGMAVRKTDDALRQQLNQALDAIVANGTYKTINDKYFPINILTLK